MKVTHFKDNGVVQEFEKTSLEIPPLELLSVYPCGTKCQIGDGIPATVTAISIRGSRVSYEVSWWDGRTRKTEWPETFEITFTEPPQNTRIGFAPRS